LSPRTFKIVVVVLLALLVGACSSPGGNASSPGAGKVTASDPGFAGLDAALVQEVLTNPKAIEKLNNLSEGDIRSLDQGMVRNFSLCRAALDVYREWLRTGTAPILPKQAAPLNPSSRSATAMDSALKQFNKDLASGDISLLRNDLTNESGCGVWIPAKAGDISGPTIADVVRGKL
jgi:hypothetical protein